MKNVLFVTILLFFVQKNSAQGTDRSEYQQQLYTAAIKSYKNGDNIDAIKTFAIIQNINPKADISKKASQKSHSLKTILTDNKINSLIGNWKWILKEGNWAIREDNLGGKMITITKDEILFYEIYRTSKKWDLIKTEKINLLRYSNNTNHTLKIENEIPEYDFSDNEDKVKLIILEKLGVIDYIKSIQQKPEVISHTAEILSSFTGIKSNSLYSYLRPMISPQRDDSDKNSPYKNADNLLKANRQIHDLKINDANK